MDDDRIWTIEESLWLASAETYGELIDDKCVMVLPDQPFVLSGRAAIDAVSATPKWSSVNFSEKQVMRPQEGLITIAYRAEAANDGRNGYVAYCTTTIRRLDHEVWRVVQHQQTPPPIATA